MSYLHIREHRNTRTKLVGKRLFLADIFEVLLSVRPNLQDSWGGHQRSHDLPVPLEKVDATEKCLVLL